MDRLDDANLARSRSPISPARAGLSVTVSIGGAHARGIQDLIERADRSLYRAESPGRNRVSIDGVQLATAGA